MCLIFVAKEGVPTLSAMERAEKVNDDGAGIAWIEQTPDKKSTRVAWKKNLKAKEVHEIINDMKLKDFLPSFPFVVHFRSASSGGVNPLLCQPFALDKNISPELEGTAKSVLFHNGTYGRWDDDIKILCLAGGVEIPGGPWNDSRFLALLAQSRGVGSLMLTNHGGYMNGSGRIAILEHTGNVKLLGSGWVDGEQKGVKQSGSLASENFCSRGVEIFRGRSREASPRLTSIHFPVNCALYEEGDVVRVYSTSEYRAILDEIKKEQDELSQAS